MISRLGFDKRPAALRAMILVALSLCGLSRGTSRVEAGVPTQAAREAAEYLLSKFGKEAVKEGAEKLAGRIESLAVRHGDDALVAIRKAGPAAIKALEEAGEHAPAAIRLLAREGDKALWIVDEPARLAIFAKYGDDAASAMLKHKALAEPLIREFQAPAAAALNSMGGQNARRLAMMANEGELAAIGQTDRLLGVITKYGDRAMEFIWRHKGKLAATAALAAFLADPEPFLEGTRQLAEVVVDDFARPIAQEVAHEAARKVNWNWLALAVVGVAGAYLGWRALLARWSAKPRTA